MVDAPKSVPVVSIVGKSGSGKTTFLVSLIEDLVTRGFHVATVKHHIHDYDIDVPGKDSWRHAQAGASTVMVSSPDKFSLIAKVDTEPSLMELARRAEQTGADILLSEGFKSDGINRVEVFRAANRSELVSDPKEMLALVTDVEDHGVEDVPVFALDDAHAVGDLIVDRFLRGDV